MGGRIAYRPEIDGLRAIAVILVVAFHVGVPGFSAGFVGVDVFFVISGFLITRLLRAELHASGRIDLADFFARRVRRLIPALTLVVVATLTLALALETPSLELRPLAESALFASVFLSNVYLQQAVSGYFGAQADVTPLLHTWSLAVEEQFYLVWPILLIALAGAGRRFKLRDSRLTASVLWVGALVSLGLFLAVGEVKPGAAFFLTPFRAWELGLGALLAVAPPVHGQRLGVTVQTLGLAAILSMTVLLGAFKPSLPVLGAVLGAVAVVAGTAAAPEGPVARLLAARVPVLIGKLSYGWYLWHWPLLALARAEDLGERVLWRDLPLAVLALGLAYLTWRLVERPVREAGVGPFRTPRGSLLAGAAMIAGCAVLSVLTLAWAQALARHEPLASAISAAGRPVRLPGPCDGSERVRIDLPPIEQCKLGDRSSRRSVLLWGDSHARDLAPGLAKGAADARLGLIPLVRSGCRPYVSFPPAKGERRIRYRRCATFSRNVLAALPELQAEHGVQAVILAARWDDDSEPAMALRESVVALRAQGLQVLLVAGRPVFDSNVPRCLSRLGVSRCALERRQFEASRRSELALLNDLAREAPGVTVWDPADQLCSPAACSPILDGEVAYIDTSHWTAKTSMRLAPAWTRVLETVVAEGPDLNPP